MKKNLLSAALMLGGLLTAETASAQTQAYLQWPLKRNNADSAAVRSAAVTPQATVFRRLVLSNGQLPTGAVAYAPYSSLGQAFGVLPDGSGWSSNNTPPGPGSNPRRTYYEQFSFTATSAVQVDSVIFAASVVSSANGRVAVVYSRSNFLSDSTDITGGKGPGGPLPATANGTFGLTTTGVPAGAAVASAVLPQHSATITTVGRTFRLALNGPTGLAVPSGQTLSVRLYFGVGSTGVGRYVLLRDVTLKSRQAVVASATRQALNTNLAVYPNPTQNRLLVPHAAAGRTAQVTVLNATGQKVAVLAAQPGSTETTVELGALAKGLYLVEYADGAVRSTARIVKE